MLQQGKQCEAVTEWPEPASPRLSWLTHRLQLSSANVAREPSAGVLNKSSSRDFLQSPGLDSPNVRNGMKRLFSDTEEGWDLRERKDDLNS